MTDSPHESAGPAGRRGKIHGWLSRPQLWDDVFTRTVATLLSAAILGVLALAAGYVHLTGRAVAVILFVLAGIALVLFEMLFEGALAALGGTRKGYLFYYHLVFRGLVAVACLTWLGYRLFT